MMVYLSDKKKEKWKFLCTQALVGDILSIRFVARVIGKIVSSLPGSEFGKLHYRNLERDKIRALALNRGDYVAKMQLSVLAKEDLLWWVENATSLPENAPLTYVFQMMPVTLAGAFLVQAMIHGSLRVYGAENKVFSILM